MTVDGRPAPLGDREVKRRQKNAQLAVSSPVLDVNRIILVFSQLKKCYAVLFLYSTRMAKDSFLYSLVKYL